MKNISFLKKLWVLLISLTGTFALAQKDPIDSMKALLKTAAHDTTRLNLLLGIAEIAEPEELEKVNAQCRVLVQKHIGKENSKMNSLFRKYNGLVMGNEGVFLAQMGE